MNESVMNEWTNERRKFLNWRHLLIVFIKNKNKNVFDAHILKYGL